MTMCRLRRAIVATTVIDQIKADFLVPNGNLEIREPGLAIIVTNRSILTKLSRKALD